MLSRIFLCSNIYSEKAEGNIKPLSILSFIKLTRIICYIYIYFKKNVFVISFSGHGISGFGLLNVLSIATMVGTFAGGMTTVTLVDMFT